MLPSRIVAVDDVHRQAPLGIDDRIRWFYANIGCLDEAPAAEPGWIVFRSARIELRIELTANPKIESAGFPVVLAIPSLEAATEMLNEESWAFEKLTGTTWADDCLATLDPAGNRVELRREWGAF
jgi:hypothetical protein